MSVEGLNDNKYRLCMMMALHHEEKGEWAEAIKFYLKALDADPGAEIHERLGVAYKKIDDMEGAEKHFSKALELEPGSVKALYGMASVDRLACRYDSAMERYLKLKSLGVDDAGVDTSMGVLHADRGQLDEALVHYERAFKKNPENDMVRFNYSLCMMAMGNFKEGMELYESRIWHAKPPGREWRGGKVSDLMVVPEQGNGDILHFCRFFHILKPLCGNVTVLCNRPLVEIMKRVEGVDSVVEFNPGDEFVESEEEGGGSDSVSFAEYVRIMSIPHVLGIDPRSVPYKKYLSADPARVEQWGRRVKSDGLLRVGLCWQGGKRNKPDMIATDKKRSIKLEEMLPVLKTEGVRFFSLQKGDDQHKDFPEVIDFMEECDDFLETAALVENLDLIITVDTAIAHLAGGLGKPVWMLSRLGGCWRWGRDEDSTFWYPSMRIFRQKEMNDWNPVILKIASELDRFSHFETNSSSPSANLT